MKIITAMSVALLLSTGHLKAQSSEMDQVSAMLGAEEKAGFSGTVLLASEGEILISKGYGFTDKSGQNPIQPSTLFNIASITKSFTAIATLQLIEKGQLKLEDRLAKFFAFVPDDKKDITIYHLLSHTSGLPQTYVCIRMSDRTPCMKAIFGEPLEEKPGQSFRYSNHNYGLLAGIIEVATGISWEEYLTKSILRPAGLTNTRFWGGLDDRDATLVAQKINRLNKKTRQRNWDFLGSAGMYSTTQDLYRWFVAIQSYALLPKAYTDMMFTPVTQTRSGIGVGYGWFISTTSSGHREYWTSGSDSFGHNAMVRYIPTKDTVIIVCSNTGEKENGTQTDNRRISNMIIEFLF